MATHKFQHWVEQGWYGKWPLWPFLLLQPLYVLTGLLRRLAYRLGLLSSWRAPVPVLVVGNITVGGTGKTPLTIALIQQAQKMGLTVGVVSRGYGRTSEETLVVTDESSPDMVGDEPLLIYQRTGAAVAVAKTRAEASQALLQNQSLDLIITDDGLQHYALARDAECIVIDSTRLFGNGWQLPSGPLREPLSRLHSAHAAVLNQRAEKDVVLPSLPVHLAISPMRLLGDQAVNILSGETQPLSSFASKPVVALAGIGNPEAFYTALRGFGLSLTGLEFPDHHAYQASDLPGGTQAVIMTEKDAVKIRGFATASCWYVPVTAQLADGFAETLIHTALDNFKARHSAGK